MKISIANLVNLFCLVLPLAGTPAEQDHHSTPVDTVISNARILDGRGGDEPTSGTVVIADGEIRAVLPPTANLPASRAHLDAQGGFLLPGFIDAHVHILVPRCTLSTSGSVVFDRALSEEMASALLSSGITTVRSPATPDTEGLALRDALQLGSVRGPFALASAEFMNDAQMTEYELREQVRRVVRRNPDYFKVYSRLSPEQVGAVVEESHRYGVPVIGHLGKTSWREGAELGIDFLTHAVDWSEQMLKPEHRAAYRKARAEKGSMLARLDWLALLDLESAEVSETIDALVAHRIPVDPTLVAYDAKFSGPDESRYRANPRRDVVPQLPIEWQTCKSHTSNWTTRDHQTWQRLLPKLQAYVKKMHDRGVILMTGSDAPNFWVIPGEGLHQEFELLVEAGISPGNVLRMTGEVAANALGLHDRGVIDVGKRADLVLLHSNPLDDIRNTRDISWVMQAGNIVYLPGEPADQ